MTAPIACDGFTVEMPLITLGLWLDGSIVSPIAGRRRGGSHPPVIADCISLPAMRVVAQPLMWLMLITIAIGMCLMNGYSVVKGHAHSPHKRGKQAESFRTSPPVSSLKGYFSTTYSKKIFQSFFGGRNRFCNGLKSASLHSCDLLIGQALKIVEDQPPLLYFGQFGDRSM